MANTRPYEVTVTLPQRKPGETTEAKIFLVDATSQAAAEKFVSAKFIGKAALANGKRVAELMSPPHHCKLETAGEA